MKKILVTLLLLTSIAWGVDAFYKHHQRTVTTSLEADLVAREVGIDASARNSLIAKKADGNLIHVISKEMDTASLNGVLNVTGQANFSAAIKAANYNANSIPFFGTGGLLSEDATNLTYNNSTDLLSTANLNLSGLTASLPVFSNGSKTLVSNAMTGSGSVMMSVSPTTTGTLTAAAVTASALVTASAGISIEGGSGAAGRITVDATNGMRVQGVVGATNNFHVRSPAGTIILSNAAGTNNWLMAADLAVTGVSTATGGVSFSNTYISPNILSYYGEGTFTATLTGCTTSPTYSVRWVRIGVMVTMTIPQETGKTSNATTKTLTGLPANLQPVTTQDLPMSVGDNGAAYVWGAVRIQGGSGTIALFPNANGDNWTASGTFGFSATSVTYQIL